MHFNLTYLLVTATTLHTCPILYLGFNANLKMLNLEETKMRKLNLCKIENHFVTNEYSYSFVFMAHVVTAFNFRF